MESVPHVYDSHRPAADPLEDALPPGLDALFLMVIVPPNPVLTSPGGIGPSLTIFWFILDTTGLSVREAGGDGAMPNGWYGGVGSGGVGNGYSNTPSALAYGVPTKGTAGICSVGMRIAMGADREDDEDEEAGDSDSAVMCLYV